MRLRSQMPRSMPTSDKLLESAASVEVRTLPVHLESKKTHVSHAPMFALDRKVVRHCNQFVVAAAHAPPHVRANHRVGQTRSIRSGKLWRRPERVRFFVDRNKMCT